MRAISLHLTKDKQVYGRILFFSGLNILAAFVLNLLLPTYIGIASYGNYRYLYSIIGFAGILHLGYLDGFYLVSLEKTNESKASVSYLCLLVSCLLLLTFGILQLFGIKTNTDPLILAAILLISNFINLSSLSLNLDQQFAGPITVQLLISIMLALLLMHPTMAIWIRLHTNQTVLLLLTIQLTCLLLLNLQQTGVGNIKLGMGQWKIILQFHQKGIKTIAIGLIIVLSMGLDKLVLKNLISKEAFGIYCFSNSFLISLLGLSLSVSNKFVAQVYQDQESLNKQYNQLVRRLSYLGLLLMAIAVGICQLQWIEIHGYVRLVKYLPAFMGLFSYLCLIQLVHSNLAKRFQLEIHFSLLYLIVLGLCFIAYQTGFRDINQMLWYTSLVFYLGFLLFDAVLNKKQSEIALGLTNKLIAAIPLVIAFWLQAKI